MRNLDFLSESPKMFIFNKEANKTNFGGILFLIYIIIMILISLAYILDYAFNDKYSIENMITYNYTHDSNENKKMNDDEELNPYLNLTISFVKFHTFTIHSLIGGKTQFLEEKKVIISTGPFYFFNLREKVFFLDFTIAYKCGNDSNCTSFKEFIDTYDDPFIGLFDFYYPRFINHTSDPPMQKVKHISNHFSHEIDFFKDIGKKTWNFDWEVIKYKDKRSLFDSLTNNKREYYSGHVKNNRYSSEEFQKYDNYTKYIQYDDNIGYYLDFFNIHFNNKHEEYLLYKRTKTEFLDVIANIGALFSTIKFFFSLIFSFYSKNFDNYKIIAHLLSPIEEEKEIKIPLSLYKKKENYNELNIINN